MKNNVVLGHKSIDHHHDEVFELDQKLDLAISENDTKYLKSIIEFLNHYVKDHFEEEETLMSEHNFDRLQTHQNEHAYFRRRFAEIDTLYKQKRHTTHVVFLIRKFLDTLIQHIIEEDAQMAHLVNSETGNE